MFQWYLTYINTEIHFYHVKKIELLIFQDIELDEGSEGDENVDPEEDNKQDIVKTENNDLKKETDINQEYDMDNYDDGEYQYCHC